MKWPQVKWPPVKWLQMKWPLVKWPQMNSSNWSSANFGVENSTKTRMQYALRTAFYTNLVETERNNKLTFVDLASSFETFKSDYKILLE